MSGEPQLFRVDPQSRESERIEEVDFRKLGFQERRDIQEWVAANPGILGEDLLIICKEFSGFDRTNERLDLLAVDPYGKLVVIELKRDDTGADAYWQAIKYASYLRRATTEEIVGMLAEHKDISPEVALQDLIQHIGGDDLNALNSDQRIILASHRFAPEVTSAALWLNSKVPDKNLITCVTLTPYRDAKTDSLYIQAITIIPVVGEEDYVVGIGGNSQPTARKSGNNFATNLKRAFDRNRDDEITHFLRKIGDLAVSGLSVETKPDKKSKWGGGWPNWRYYHLWYARPPWSNWGMSYRINLWPQDEENSYIANVEFKHQLSSLERNLADISLHTNQQRDQSGIEVRMGTDTLNDDFAGRIADMLCHFIEKITPIVDNLEDENNEEEA